MSDAGQDCPAYIPIHAYRVREVKHELSISYETAQMPTRELCLRALTKAKTRESLTIISQNLVAESLPLGRVTPVY